MDIYIYIYVHSCKELGYLVSGATKKRKKNECSLCITRMDVKQQNLLSANEVHCRNWAHKQPFIDTSTI